MAKTLKAECEGWEAGRLKIMDGLPRELGQVCSQSELSPSLLLAPVSRPGASEGASFANSLPAAALWEKKQLRGTGDDHTGIRYTALVTDHY